MEKDFVVYYAQACAWQDGCLLGKRDVKVRRTPRLRVLRLPRDV